MNKLDFITEELEKLKCLRGHKCLNQIFQIDKLYLKGKVQGVSFHHFREDRAIMKDKDYLQNIYRQAKCRDLEKHINQIGYELYNLTQRRLPL